MNEFSNNKTQNQFELKIGDETAFIEYYIQDKKIFFNHTEVPVTLRGKGVAAQLVEKSLEYSRKHEFTVVPSCSYVAHFVNNHPEWNDILSEGYQM